MCMVKVLARTGTVSSLTASCSQEAMFDSEALQEVPSETGVKILKSVAVVI